MAEEITTPGTTEESTGTTAGATAPVADGSAPTADGSDREASPTLEEIQAEIERLKNVNAQLLSEKTSGEEARRKLEEYERGNQRPPTTDPRQFQVEQQMRQQQEIIQRVQQDAAAGDYYAQFALQTAQFQFQQLQELRDDVRTQREPEAVAARAKQIRAERPHFSMDDALMFARQEQALAEASKPKPMGVGDPKEGAIGSPRPAAAITPTPGSLTPDQYASRIEALERAGKWDERRQLVLQRSRGLIKVA